MLRSLLVVAALSTPTLAAAAELHVGQGQPFPSIQAAVDAARDFDVVVVHAGTYAEQVVVDRVELTHLEIRGYGADVVTIDAPDQAVNAIIANTVNLTLRNLVVEAPNHANPAQRAVNFISETGSGTERFEVGLCNVTLRGHDIAGGAGVACTVGQNDTLQVRGDSIRFLDLANNVSTTCFKETDWDMDQEFCSRR
jgi:hypothetical protein